MAFQDYPVLCLLVLLGLLTNGIAVSPSYDTASLNRTSFPKGAANEDGRGPSIWDTFTHRYPGRIKDGSNGDVAIDQYHHYKKDVQIMKKMGLDAYRFSISWSRVLPKGKLSGGVNREGIKYYNNLINKLLAKGLQPFVTLYHYDLPQALEDEYGGFLSPHIADDFQDYAELCFKEFGDRVKHWITLNEPYGTSYAGYALGIFPPARCSSWQQLNCLGGDSGTEPYLVAHNQLLAHASAVKVYKQKYQIAQKGIIGITLVSHWFVPISNARHDRDAALRALDFMFGIFMDPLTNGDYPHSVRSLVGHRLPKFTKEQSNLVNGSFDFLGLNYYTANYAAYSHHSNAENASYLTNSLANLSTERNGIPIGPKAGSDWLYIYPRGIRELLLYIKRKYNNPLIFITENGISEVNNATLSLKEALADNYRIDYYYRHLQYLHSAIKDGVNVKGYFAWSILDNFEWNVGYTVRFGINYVDYENGLKRHPKLSARWFKKFLKK
ncbi:beta-glucosidase 12-like isoform X2 [Quercus robur]|uniref:beta-glucosidase 12-like isoform X2 n=2 Tax=Quercus robur TaxID=38942 RepID=UPI0021630314|nr:beta-glucosidase 12-like isoform X2 [Quercus robur]